MNEEEELTGFNDFQFEVAHLVKIYKISWQQRWIALMQVSCVMAVIQEVDEKEWLYICKEIYEVCKKQKIEVNKQTC